MKELLETIAKYRRNVNRLAVFYLLVIVLLCQFTYAERKIKISQFGITWTFNRDYTVGQFANGDYWVLGPITIIGIDPPSTETNGRTMNGSMVNPSPKLGATQGYDSAMYGSHGPYFDPNLNVGRPNNRDLIPRNPLVLQPHSSLVSTISIPKPGNRPQLRTAAILTVLREPAPEGSFRPPYCGTNKTIKFNKDQLDYSWLANLRPVPGAPGIMAVERYFERPWIDHIPGWMGRYHHPTENMPDYGREISTRIGIGALKLNLNLNNQMKEVLLVRFVQLGIDLYGIVQDGGKRNWVNNGGHASGRKWPILFAGLVLNDPDMKNIGRIDIANYGPSHQEYVHFGEDDQTFYVGDEDIYEPPYKRHVWHGGFVYYGHGKGDKHRDYLEYTEEHRDIPEWGIEHATDRNQDGLDWNTSYRPSSTANAWAGFILTAHIMGVKELWNHDALFDYMDRYMEVQKQVAGVGHWTRQWSRFIEKMWDAYRPDYGPVWTMSPILNIAATGGSVTKSPDKAAYTLGEKVILKAAADDGYEFAGWSGGLSGTENPVTIIMHANRTVTANFATRNNTPTHNSK
ncbi:MAG: hypothetical protein IIB56_07070 [Planctomycetes bacterium]|nr:hypothetical protein [Planctomycetota bacterium]